MAEFLRLITPDEFIRRLARFDRLPAETVPLDASLARFLEADAVAPEDLPEQARSTVDGFAVRAEDTFGASDSIPALLEITGAVDMGTIPGFAVGAGRAARIPTGGFLPPGTDAVVMVEYTNPAAGNSIEVTRPVTLHANVIEKAEDARTGDPIIPAGRRLRPQELGLLAALGITEVRAGKRPRVAVMSTGDEVIPIDRKPRPGQVRDANLHSVSALVRAWGGDPMPFEIVPDDAAALRSALQTALSQTDIVVLSGGSSVGVRDLLVEAVEALPGAEILAHGVAVRPGKPTLLAADGGKAIFGLPGHPVSAFVVAHVFLVPFLTYLQGGELKKGPIGHSTMATLATSIHSTTGLEEFVRVRLEESPTGGFVAHPLFGKSAMLSTLVKADGLVAVPMQAEGLARGDVVNVIRT